MTQTIALQIGSPAIDAIPFTSCTDQSSPPKRLTTDQRDFPRPDPEDGPTGPCDIGAYEYQDPHPSPTPSPTPSASPTPSQSAPDVSLSGVPASAPYGSSFTVTTNNHGTTTSVPTISAGPSNVCSINGSAVTMKSGTGTCSVTAKWAAEGKYAAASITDMANATKVPLTVTANDAAMTFGQPIPTFKASYGGFVKHENESVLSGSPSLTTTATACSPSGSYAIKAALGTLASTNYSFATFKDGTLTVDRVVPKVDLTVDGSTSSTVFLGQTVTFMARIHADVACPVSPSGSITISESMNGAVQFGTAMVMKDRDSNDGLATIMNSRIVAGNYTLLATYGGDDKAKYYYGAQSNTVSLHVKPKLGGPPTRTPTHTAKPTRTPKPTSTANKKPTPTPTKTR